MSCGHCGAAYGCRGNWLDCLPEPRATAFTRFTREYGEVRRREGRGSDDASYYLALPVVPSGAPLASQWAIRRRSFEQLVAFLARQVATSSGAGSRAVAPRVLDLGAGNGWLSHRLTQRGYHTAAVDVFTDERDGLGAARQFTAALGRPLACFRAEFDRLPFADACVDVAVFNASLHYSADYGRTLAEAVRVLAPAGWVIILDSPIYSSTENGERMVRERQAAFNRRFGFPSDALGSREFLTPGQLDELGHRLGLAWQVEAPWYGWRWALRQPAARLAGRREPARFALVAGRRR